MVDHTLWFPRVRLQLESQLHIVTVFMSPVSPVLLKKTVTGTPTRQNVACNAMHRCHAPCTVQLAQPKCHALPMHQYHARPSLPVNQIPILTPAEPGVNWIHDTAARPRHARGPVQFHIDSVTFISFILSYYNRVKDLDQCQWCIGSIWCPCTWMGKCSLWFHVFFSPLLCRFL